MMAGVEEVGRGHGAAKPAQHEDGERPGDGQKLHREHEGHAEP